jgi:hypothetical protein
MAGQRLPQSSGLASIADAIDTGTTCLARTPAPGSVGSTSEPAPAQAGIGSLSDVATAIDEFRRSDNWASLQPIVYAIVGPQSFGLGVVYGMGENLVLGVLGLADVARTFLLADLYDRAQRSDARSFIGPLGALQQLIAEASMYAFARTLEQAYHERQALIDELGYAITHPGEVFERIGADYASKWNEFLALGGQRRLTSQFRAGRILGEVLADLLALIGGGAAVVKGAAKIPRLARLARPRAVMRTPAPKAVGPFSTPSQLRGAAPAAGAEAAAAPVTPQGVTKMPKGQRPAPSTYWSPEAAKAHLAPFESEGAVKIVSRAPEGPIGPPQGTFVMQRGDVAKVVADSGGDVRKLEQLLGLEKGSLGDNPMIVDVTRPTGLRIPSGNEPGANPLWQAGGVTSGGVREAVVDQILPGNYTVRPVFPR